MFQRTFITARVCTYYSGLGEGVQVSPVQSMYPSVSAQRAHTEPWSFCVTPDGFAIDGELQEAAQIAASPPSSIVVCIANTEQGRSTKMAKPWMSNARGAPPLTHQGLHVDVLFWGVGSCPKWCFNGWEGLLKPYCSYQEIDRIQSS